jgi:hypothetical protein
LPRGGSREHGRTWLPSLASRIARICGSFAAMSSPASASALTARLSAARWFGVIVGATPRLGELRRGETIPWRVIAAQLAPRGRRSSR